MLLHVLLAVVIPNIKFDKVKMPEVLTVELVAKPEPPPLAQPEPIQPQPEQIKPKVEPKSEPKPIINRLPTPTVVKDEPAPHQVPPTTQTEVIAVAPKADVPPAITAPPQSVPTPQADLPKQSEPTDDGFKAAKIAYTANVLKEIQNNLRYPRIARDRGIKGKAKVEVYLDKDGNVVSVAIIESSGNGSLDAEAIAVVKRSNLKQYMTEILSGKIDVIKLPVVFSLTDS